MTEVASRELRHDTAGLLRCVQGGEDVVITVSGRAVARLVPVQTARRRWIERDERVRRLADHQADKGLRSQLHDLEELAVATDEDLRPPR